MNMLIPSHSRLPTALAFTLPASLRLLKGRQHWQQQNWTTLIHLLLKNKKKECVVSLLSVVTHQKKRIKQWDLCKLYQIQMCFWLVKNCTPDQCYWWFAEQRQNPSQMFFCCFFLFVCFTSVSKPIHIKYHLDMLTGSQTRYSSERVFINIPHLSG